jgi:hypothetical protein
MAGQLSTYCGSSEMRQYLDQRVSPLVVEQALPGTHAVATVAGAARHVAHLASRFMEDSRLSALAWYDMLMAAVWIVNRRPSVTAPGTCTPFELATGLKPNLSELRVQPGRLVGCRRLSGHSTSLSIGSELGYLICPDQGSAGYLVRSFKSNDIFPTNRIVRFDSHEAHQVIAARHSLQSHAHRFVGFISCGC